MCRSPAWLVEIRCRIPPMSSQEQPEDQQPDDENGEAEKPDTGEPEADKPETGEAEADEAEADKPPTEDERLEQVTDRIEKARTGAEDAGVIEEEDQEYVESGATEEEDDQTITPPG